MEKEILTLLRENNEMLKCIIKYINLIESKQYQQKQDLREFMINMTANIIH